MLRRIPPRWISAVLLLLLIVGCAMLAIPLTTLQGVNYRVTSYRIPAYVKTIDFLQRHYQYQQLVYRICAGKTSDADCVLAIFDWTHQNVPLTPAGWRVIDDHPLHIVVRGHGTSDQIADVFTVLTGYAGVPAFFKWIKDAGSNTTLVLVFAYLEGKWVPFDVERHVTFRDSQGALTGVDNLMADPALMDAHTVGILPGGLRYSTFISREKLALFVAPQPTRTEMQQPWPRLQHELRQAARWHRE